MQTAALRKEAVESYQRYIHWKTNEYLGLEWGEEGRRIYLEYLRDRAHWRFQVYKTKRMQEKRAWTVN